jgi:hypothetical protein
LSAPKFAEVTFCTGLRGILDIQILRRFLDWQESSWNVVQILGIAGQLAAKKVVFKASALGYHQDKGDRGK